MLAAGEPGLGSPSGPWPLGTDMCDFGTRLRLAESGGAEGMSPSIVVETSGISAVLAIDTGEHQVSCWGALRGTWVIWGGF